ncbi:MAG: hypothetical protein GYB68_09695 [Chloroflexi bacterium]|nr:hypothetical protein [Chloroflexota bacterium]
MMTWSQPAASLGRSVLLLLALAAIACNFPACAPSEPSIDVDEDPTRTPLPPTLDVSELPPTTPQIVAQRPFPGEELPLNGSIDLYFDQPMNQATVEDGLSLSPALPYELTWVDGATLRLTPNGLERANAYTVSIDSTAQSAEGLALADDLTVAVETVGFLEVGQVSPAPDSPGVETDSVITVFFNRPVVPLTVGADQSTLPQPLTISPQVAGQGEWINTSIYMWRPDQALPGGTSFSVTIADGLTSSTGAVMQDPFGWSFTTVQPAVLSLSPEPLSENAPLDAPIELTFNQPMNRQSVQDSLTVQAEDGTPIAGSAAWDDEGRTLIFTPSGLLPYGNVITVSVGSTASSLGGGAALGAAYTTSFRTVLAPGIRETFPEDGGRPEGFFPAIPRICFNSPMDEASLQDKFVFEPEPLGDYDIFYSEFDFCAGPTTDFEASTTYTVTLLPGARDVYGRSIDEPFSFTFTNNQLGPEVQLNVTDNQYGVYDAGRAAEVFMLYRNVERVDFRLSQLTNRQFIDTFNFESPNSLYQLVVPDEQVLREWSVDAEQELDASFYERVTLSEDGGALAPGVYLLQMSSPQASEREVRHLMVVSTANLLTKFSFNEALVWLTDLDTGQAIAGQPVTLYDRLGAELANGSTDDDGLLQVGIPPQDNLYDNMFAISASGDVFAAAWSGWSEGINPWDFGLPFSGGREPFSVYMYTDRPLYRPGQEVFFKGVLRDKFDVTYSLPTISDVQLTLFNNEEAMATETVQINEYGTFDGSFLIPDGAQTGFYRMELAIEDRIYSQGFQVAEFTAPEFTVNVESDEPELVVGDTIQVTVSAEFFFGGPVSDAEVSWTALLGESVFDYEGPGRFQFSDYNWDESTRRTEDFIPGFGERIADGEGVTGPDGVFTIELPASLIETNDAGLLTLEAVVSDVNGRQVAGRTEIVIHQADLYVGVQPDNYVGAAGDPQMASLIVVDWDSNPVANQAVEVQVVERRWSSVREEDEFGRVQWVVDVEEIPIGDPIPATTNASGRASISYTPPNGGVFKLTASVIDAAGNTSRGAAFQWVQSDSFISWRQPNNDRIDLVSDKDRYTPGETAEILITSPFAGRVQALVTLERGSILETQLISLENNSYLLEVPITGELAPNVYVSVTIVKGVDETNPVPEFRMGMVELEVEPIDQTLNVEVIPSSDVVGPQEEVTYEVRTTDSQGNPVDAEVSLALVDLAVLSLTQPNSGPIVEHFYSDQLLGVRTAMPMVHLVNRQNQELFDQGKGGGGGGEEGFFDVRGDFRDTAYWEATLRTGSDGVEEVTITLPDNLTTWRMDARAITPDTRVGQAQVDITSNKPLLIRPGTPSFVVAGDQLSLGATVNNNTDESLEAVVELAASGVELQGEAVQRVTVPAFGRVQLYWPVTVNPDANFLDLTFQVQSGDLTDASKPVTGDPEHDNKIPVIRFEVPETVGTAGLLPAEGAEIEGIVLPPTYNVTAGEVSVRIDPSLASATLDGLDVLRTPRTDFSEAIVSSFLPNAVTAIAFREFGLSDAEFEAELNANVEIALQRLIAQRNIDGGWGWATQSESDSLVTAYVLQGLLAAREAGYRVDETVVTGALSYLSNERFSLQTISSSWALQLLTYIDYVSTLAGSPDAANTSILFEQRGNMQYWARALLAQSIWLQDPTDPRLSDLQSDLVNSALLSATGAPWEEDQVDSINWNTDTRTTAIVLDTFATVWPDHELAPNIVRWLMVARDGSAWETSQESTWAILGLTEWMRATRELEAAYDWSFFFNGAELVSTQVNSSNVTDTTLININVEDLLTDAVNRLQFQRSAGVGRLYYAAHLTAYLPVEQVQPLSRGLVVSRRFLNEAGQPVTSGAVGDILTVEVTVIAPEFRYFVVVEDIYPAGAEPINVSFETESILNQGPSIELDTSDPLSQGWGWWLLSGSELRADRAMFYVESLPAGTYQFTYQVRLGLPGQFQVIPVTAYESYFPEVNGRGEGMLFTVSE